jgi:hypothetical protein
VPADADDDERRSTSSAIDHFDDLAERLHRRRSGDEEGNAI